MGFCSMMTHGGDLACACLMAVLRVVFLADRVAGIMATWMQTIIGFIARILMLDGVIAWALMVKINVITHVLGTAFVLNICAAMICAMARFLQDPFQLE